MQNNANLIEYANQFGYNLDYLSSGSPIFQLPSHYTFSSDSIALAHFVKEKEIETLVDLCAGSGVVGLELVDTKNVGALYMVEIQQDLSQMSARSAKFNTKKTKIVAINKSLVGSFKELPSSDVVVVNPPYFKVGSGDVPQNLSRACARHEISVTLSEIILEASLILKPNGKFYMVHIKSRQNEIEKLLLKHNFKLLSTKVLSGKLERILVEAVKQKTY